MEAIGHEQTVASGTNIVFDTNEDVIDSVGYNITLDATGTIFTITHTGLYLVDWSVNLAPAETGETSAVIGILENGERVSGSSTLTAGNFSSGTLIYVDAVPYTLSLHNFANPVTLANASGAEGTEVSIRIARFADGPSEPIVP